METIINIIIWIFFVGLFITIATFVFQIVFGLVLLAFGLAAAGIVALIQAIGNVFRYKSND